MKAQTAVMLATVLCPLMLACGGSDSALPPVGCTSAPVTNAQQQVACMGASAIAKEANNYSFASEIKLPPVTVKSMTNLTFDWSAVTEDFLGHTLDPATDVDAMLLLLWRLPLATLETNLNADSLLQDDLQISPPPSWVNTGATSTQLYMFNINGTPLEPAMFDMNFDPALFPSSAYSYMVGAQSGDVLGQGLRMLQTFNLDPASSTTTVALKNDSTRLTCSVSLRNLTITGVPGGTPNLMLDWSDIQTPTCADMVGGTCPAGSTAGSCPATGIQSCLTFKKNALGATFQQGYVTRAIVGHYTETPAELEKKFLDLDLIATAYYNATIDIGSVLDFTTLRDANQATFPGVSDDGTWLVGLFCGNCRNPAPWYMTILKPCTP